MIELYKKGRRKGSKITYETLKWGIGGKQYEHRQEQGSKICSFAKEENGLSTH